MKDASNRITKWSAKYRTDRMKAVLDEQRNAMLSNYSTAITELCKTEARVRQVLESRGVQTILYVPYLNYGRELFRLSRRRGISENSFRLAARVLRVKWQTRGLDPVVLTSISSQVFNLAEPD